jgi:hypothetical protein
VLVGDSQEDLDVAHSWRFSLLAHAVEQDFSDPGGNRGPAQRRGHESGNGEGFCEAVVRSLAGAH